jgi:formylglycine-generating enzyme required for sulfatase activity
MKRRELIQYASLCGIGWATGLGEKSLSASLSKSKNLGAGVHQRSQLQSFDFQVIRLDVNGSTIARTKHHTQFFTTELSSGVPLDMVAIPSGHYQMGSSVAEAHSSPREWPQHAVELQPFFIGKYPVTQAQWQAVARMPRIKYELLMSPSHFKGAQYPVESVSWMEAVEFCDRLSAYTGRAYRLPSEAEWEYACRAGSKTPFHFGDTLTSAVANYGSTHTYAAETGKDYRQSTMSVGSFSPNAFGLYDMHGNVWEWCADHWHVNYQLAPSNGSAWTDNGDPELRSLRGGAWPDHPANLRSTHRAGYLATGLNRIIGFRVSCV